MNVPLRSSLLSQDRFARAAWSRVAEPGDPVANFLIRTHGPVEALLVAASGVGQKVERFLPRLEVLDVERDLEVGAKFAARIVCPGDPEWPQGLDDLVAPPYCLWVRGPIDVASSCQRSAAVVGARSATAYGEMVATEMAAGLGERRFTIISGAAFGIDAAAHRGALATGATTIAVLAGGVERPYPSSHAALIARIVEVGAVISEVAPGSSPTKTRFLQRNRMIATMSRGTVVVEAGLRSGSLNTARTAAEHGRVVAAVPGPVTSMMSAGCHEEIRSGMALLVTDAAEAAEAIGDYGSDLAPARRGPTMAGDELDEPAARLLSALPVRKGVSVARLAVSSGLSVAEVRSLLGRLDLSALAERHGEGWRQGPAVRKRAVDNRGLPSS
ncbi:MAG TPA: DNA-processing protein DprA [Dermatophilaceae bacterium]|nr:DNA-processing protein DprA [Dermatophilaceae bacterium]